MPRVAFLWHLHQPDYRDPDTGVPTMQWTRMHALRGYRDMVRESVEAGHRWTLNLVPSLLDQLDHYSRGGSDPHLDLTRVPADALDAAQRAELVERFVTGHPAMRRAQPAWDRLARRVVGGDALTEQDLRDLQVWSTLGWFGATARRDRPAIDALRAKGVAFTEDDKAVMLQVQAELLAEIPQWWRELGASSGPGVSASPYDHPILPLLIDARTAHRAMPDLPDDVAFAWPDDALEQLRRGRDRVGEVVGTPPIGLWPSEGAVCPEVVALAREAGFRWLCSDLGVLGASGRTGHGHGGWDLGDGMRGFFRDTSLSDAIGFRSADRDPRQAAAAFTDALAAQDGLVVVALDGENPWESFADAGEAYRRCLAEALEARGVEMVRLDDVVDETPVGRIDHLHSGSWIGANFAIWAGHPEDRAAWRALASVRDAAAEAPSERFEAARPHLYAAEGSDWFWWFGDDFDTPFVDRFDALFRAHLAAAWRALGLEPPASLRRPIHTALSPTVHPQQRWLNGLDGTWAAELGAGWVTIPQGSMARGAGSFLWWGWGREGDHLGRLHVRLQGEGLSLQLDGQTCALASQGTSVLRPTGQVEVQVFDHDGPVWPQPVRLMAPALDALWSA